jgi:hypothetical protein
VGCPQAKEGRPKVVLGSRQKDRKRTKLIVAQVDRGKPRLKRGPPRELLLAEIEMRPPVAQLIGKPLLDEANLSYNINVGFVLHFGRKRVGRKRAGRNVREGTCGKERARRKTECGSSRAQTAFNFSAEAKDVKTR